MSDLNQYDYQACRAFARLHCDYTEGWDELEAADAQFDGGEWSGSAWGDNWQRADEHCCRVIADRFELPSAEYVSLIVAHYYAEMEYRSMPPNERPLPADAWGEDVHSGTHRPECAEYWDRGLECRCIPEDVKAAIRAGARPEEVM